MTSSNSQSTQPRLRFLQLDAVSDLTGLGHTKVYKLLETKEFPEPVRIGRSVRWFEDEILVWMDSLRKARDAVTGFQPRKIPKVGRPRLAVVPRPAPAPVAFGTAHTRNLG